MKNAGWRQCCHALALLHALIEEQDEVPDREFAASLAKRAADYHLLRAGYSRIEAAKPDNLQAKLWIELAEDDEDIAKELLADCIGKDE